MDTNIESSSLGLWYVHEAVLMLFIKRKEKSMNQETIGKFIATCRKEANITQREFAEKLGITDKTVSRWENGHYLPDISLFEEICEILDIDVIELLNARRMNNKIEEEVKKTVMDIVDISNKKIAEQKRKNDLRNIIFTVIVVALVCVLFYFIQTRTNYSPFIAKTNEPTKYEITIATKEKEDGWVCIFTIEGHISKREISEYNYDCYNFKHPNLPGFYTDRTELKIDDEYVYFDEISFPAYSHNLDYLDEVSKTSEFFYRKWFTDSIVLNDLAYLELSVLDKQEIVDLYNQAIQAKPYAKYGRYPNIIAQRLYSSKTIDGYSWEVGYILVHGNIVYVDINLLINNEFLIDLVESGKATEQQKVLYETIEDFEEVIVKKQKFEIDSTFASSKPFDLLQEILHTLELEEQNYSK